MKDNFRKSCEAFATGHDVESANAWLTEFQNHPECGSVCLAILSNPQVEGRTSIFTAAKLLSVVLQKGILGPLEEADIAWHRDAAMTIFAALRSCIEFAVRRQLCRCVALVVVAEFKMHSSMHTREYISPSLETCYSFVTESESMLQCALYILRELPVVCPPGTDLVGVVVHSSRSVLFHAVDHAFRLADPDSTLSALQCLLEWTAENSLGSWLRLSHVSTEIAFANSNGSKSILATVLHFVDQCCEKMAAGQEKHNPDDYFVHLTHTLELLTELLAEPTRNEDESVVLAAAGVSRIYVSVLKLWWCFLLMEPESWYASIEDPRTRQQALTFLHTRSHMLPAEISEKLVEVTVSLAERHFAVLTNENDPFISLRRTPEVAAVLHHNHDVNLVRTRLMACLIASLGLGSPTSCLGAFEILNKPPPFLQNSVHHAHRAVQPLVSILKRQLISSFALPGCHSEDVVAFELAQKYKDTHILKGFDNEDDMQGTLLAWLEFRSEVFQLLQGLAASWPSGDALLESVYGEFQADFAVLVSFMTSDKCQSQAQVIEALIFMLHGLLECAFTPNSYANSEDTTITRSVRNVFQMGLQLCKSLQMLPKSKNSVFMGIFYRCMKLWALLPDIIGYTSRQEDLTTLPTEDTRQVLELLCNTFESCIYSREACINALLAMTSSLNSIFVPHALPLCTWIDSTLCVARAEAETLETLQFITAINIEPDNHSHAFHAPVLVSAFADKLHLCLGRVVANLDDHSSGELLCKLFNTSIQQLETWHLEIAHQTNIGVHAELHRWDNTAAMCTYHLKCLHGMVRGLEDGTSAEPPPNSDASRYGGAERAYMAIIPSLQKCLLQLLNKTYLAVHRDLDRLGPDVAAAASKIVTCGSKVICKMAEEHSELAATLGSLLLYSCFETLNYSHSFNESIAQSSKLTSVQKPLYFPPFSGVVDVLYTSIRMFDEFNDESTLKTAQKTLLMSFYSCKYLHYMTQLITATAGSGAWDHSAVVESAPFRQELEYLSTQLKLTRHIGRWHPNLLLLPDVGDGSIIPLDGAFECLFLAMDVSLHHFDAGLVRAINLAWSTLYESVDIRRHMNLYLQCPGVTDRLLSKLIVGSAFLHTKRLTRTFVLILDTVFDLVCFNGSNSSLEALASVLDSSSAATRALLQHLRPQLDHVQELQAAHRLILDCAVQSPAPNVDKAAFSRELMPRLSKFKL